MKVFKLFFIVTLAVLLVNISGVSAEFNGYYTNSDLERYKYDSTGEIGVFTNSDLKRYEGRYKPTLEKFGISKVEEQQREIDYETTRAERLLKQERAQKRLSEQEALEGLIAHKVRHSYDRIRALQIRFCDYRQDAHASYISCGHKLRQDGHPFTAMKLKQQIDSCLNPDTCFYTIERQVMTN